ncbi:MAG: 23S rRNA (uracil(1939)-C(5))-methyltransferase RlmD [Casimicrobiaceae bacterium]
MDPVVITALDQEGRGIARVDGKAIFVEGALIGERVDIEVYQRKPNYERARAVEIFNHSAVRVTPRCPHFGTCGGCSLQHIDAAAQVAVKQRVLEDALWHIGRVRPQQLLAPIYGPTWGYRQRARLSVRNVPKKGGVLVGFRERKSTYVTDMSSCEVLPPNISALLPGLRALIGRLSIHDRIPQIELARGESAGGPVDVLVLRILAALTPADEHQLAAFADLHRVHFWVQTGGPATVVPLHPRDSRLAYELADFSVRFDFDPTDFTQVNSDVNRALVRRAMGLLDPAPGERIADFFCGLGNFTLPIARHGTSVIGIEGSASLVRRASANAAENGLTALAQFTTANLFKATAESLAALGPFDKALIDPPREGAIELVKALPGTGLGRIVYVSCNPATLARDASVLVNEQRYTLRAAGIANMFPHTAHVESIALFEREPASTQA